MGHIKIVIGFGWRYLARYWTRLAAGILLGVVFGMSNASFIWATKTIMERFKTQPPAAIIPDLSRTAERMVAQGALNATSALRPIRALPDVAPEVARIVDRWLPRAGQLVDWRQMLGGLLLLPLLVSIRGSAEYLSNYCMGWVGERAVNDMRVDVLKQINTLSLDFFNRSTTGDLLTRINVDTAKLLRCLKAGAADLIKEPISMVSVLIALCWINWRLTIFALVLLPLCMFPLLVLGKKARRASKAGLKAEILQASQLVELIASIRVAKAYSLEDEQVQRFKKLSDKLIHHGMKGVKAKEMVNPLIEVISMFGLSALILYIFKSQTTVGDFVGFLTGMMLFFLPVKKLAGVHVLFEQASIGVLRLAEIMNEVPAVRESVHAKRLAGFHSEIRFENVTFAYKERAVLDGFNLEILAGSKIGVAGPSGSGKSTLINLLLRFYDPGHGRITLDGLDLRDVSLRDLRGHMALVSQEIVLFDQTVAENIACGKRGATRAEIEAAARAAYAHDFIMQLPQGYDSRVGERGVTLSGGQRQRIAIARAFVRNAPILILDEATGSLDSEAEAEVQKAIDHLSENRTVLAVAHRLSTLAASDRIIVLSEGRVVEQGPFEALLQQGGLFASMARRQGIFPSNAHAQSVR